MIPAVVPIMVPLVGTALVMLPYLKNPHWVAFLCASCSFAILCTYIPATANPLTYNVLVWMNPLEFSIFIDRLSLLIALLISFLFSIVSVYSFHIKSRKYHSLVLLDLSVVLLSVLSQSRLGFYICLEMSTVITYFLVIHRNTQESIRAGFIYIIMNLIGAALILLGILLDVELPPTASTLFIAGCLVKAGFVPAHIWITRAHPVAPSPISALLSGVMVKVGIYGIIRFSPSLNADLSLLMPIALVSMLLGVFSALMQSDIKKILAYHTVSQIGFILLGVSLMSYGGGMGGLLHLVNHALFKGLLFLCAGAIIYSTETRDLHDLGGLAKHMPVTAVACLVGSLAISGIPPFNGYVSKCILSEASPAGYITIIFSITCAGTLASFIKLFRHIFMGPPGKNLPRRKIPLSMKIPLIIVSCLCLFTGIFSGDILSFVGYQPDIHVWSISHLPQILLNVGMGIALYVSGMKSGILLNPPQIRVSIDRIYHESGKAVEYVSKKFHDTLVQDINYYTLSIILVLIAIYILYGI